MIDTHCHIDSPRFAPDREQVLERAREAGVSNLVAPSVGPETWEPLLEWAEGRPAVHVALGIHPQLLPDLDPADDPRHLARLGELLEKSGAVAIGECGLDAPSGDGAPMARQVAMLRGHFALARRFGLPVLIHCLRAHETLMEVLGQEPLPAGGVLHSYSGSAEQVRKYLAFDLHFSFAGPVTYERAKKPALAARAAPRHRLLIETDAPDQTPRPFGGRCEPAHLVRVAEGLGAALGLSREEVEALTNQNARKLFRLPEPGSLS